MSDTEERIRRHHDEGELQAALTVALEAYGQEMMGYLLVRLGRDETLAADAFSLLGENLWKGLPQFAWRSSFRTWMYVVARNAASRVRSDRHRRAVPLSQVSELVARVRTETLGFLRTEAKERFAEARAELSPEDRELLVLRLSRKLSWNDIAMILEGRSDPSPDELAKLSARYRQRYQAMKKRLRKKMGPPER